MNLYPRNVINIKEQYVYNMIHEKVSSGDTVNIRYPL